jgi:hypothetical protein
MSVCVCVCVDVDVYYMYVCVYMYMYIEMLIVKTFINFMFIKHATCMYIFLTNYLTFITRGYTLASYLCCRKDEKNICHAYCGNISLCNIYVTISNVHVKMLCLSKNIISFSIYV